MGTFRLFLLSGLVIVPQSHSQKLSTQSPTIISVEVYVQGDSTPVRKYFAKLLDQSGNPIDSAYSGDTNSVQLNGIPTGVKDPKNPLPREAKLEQNYPNPFNPSTNIEFEIAKHSPVELKIYNVLGQEIKTLLSTDLEPGRYQAIWHGENNSGEVVANGVYFYQLIAGGKLLVGKMIDNGGDGGNSTWRQIGSGKQLESMLQKVAMGATPNDVYTLQIINVPQTKPQIKNTEFTIPLAPGSNTVVAYAPPKNPQPTLNLPNQISMQEDMPPLDSVLADMWIVAVAKDSANNIIADSLCHFSVATQSNPGLINSRITDNRFWSIDSLKEGGFGSSNVVVGFETPNGQYIEKKVNLNVREMRDISGTLTDDEGKPRYGVIRAANELGDTVIVFTDHATGKYHLQIPPSTRTSIEGYIKSGKQLGGFDRILPIVYGRNDTTGIDLDAVPPLPDSSYIGLDTLSQFANLVSFDGNNTGMGYEGLKKARLDSLQEAISSSNTLFGDTLTPEMQTHIKRVIEQKIDSHFKHPSLKYLVPQDSTMHSPMQQAINWFRDKSGNLGTELVLDNNNDGITDVADITLQYKDSTGVDRPILKEGLVSRLGGGEIADYNALIRHDQTVLHALSSATGLQPADDWMIKIAEYFAPLTQHGDILKVVNFESPPQPNASQTKMH